MGQPCQVTITGLGWGPPPGAVMRHVRKFQGVTMVKVEGDLATVQFNHLAWADKFRGEGGSHVVEGYRLDVGEVVTIGVEEIDCELETSVAVAVKSRGVKVRRVQKEMGVVEDRRLV